MKDLDYYIERFSHLRTDKKASRGLAPHKPVMLLAVLDILETGRITKNEIRFDTPLLMAFRDYFDDLAPLGWDRNAALPFFHLRSDGFWHITAKRPIYGQLRNNKAIREHVEKVELDPELFELLQDPANARRLRRVLTTVYFGTHSAKVEARNDTIRFEHELSPLLDLWAATTFKLVGGPAGSLRETVVAERDPRFVTMVMSLYDHACAICRLKVRTVTGVKLVDAAHIVPHAQFHNDDPRNGLALCKNHHWAFDRGLLTMTPEYRVEVSPTLDEKAPTEWELTRLADAKIRVPEREALRPAKEALEWHRENVFWSA